MAESGDNQRPSISIPITIRVDSTLLESTVLEGDRMYGDRTNIIDSNIGTVVAGIEPDVGDAQPSPRALPSADQPVSHVTVEAEKQAQLEDVGQQMAEMNLFSGRASVLIDRARYLLAKSDYEGVAKLLDDPVITSTDDIAGKTLLAEAYLMRAREAKAPMIIKALKKVVMTSQMTGNDVMVYAKDLAANSAHTRAVILFPIACDLFCENASSPDDAVNSIHECIDKLDDSVRALISAGSRLSVIGEEWGVHYLEQMYKNLCSVENANSNSKILKQAWALNWIGFNYNKAGNYEKSLKLRYNGLQLLEKQFNINQSAHRVCGNLLHNIGVAYFNLRKFTEAEEYYFKAIKSYEKATDFPSESKKQEAIEASRKDLDNISVKK